MTSTLMTFNEVVEQAAADKTADDARKTFSKRQAPMRPQAVEPEYVIPSDRELTSRLSQGIAKLQEAMDSASKGGLIVEPTFKSVSGRFNEFGVSMDSYICSVEIFRKLS